MPVRAGSAAAARLQAQAAERQLQNRRLALDVLDSLGGEYYTSGPEGRSFDLERALGDPEIGAAALDLINAAPAGYRGIAPGAGRVTGLGRDAQGNVFADTESVEQPSGLLGLFRGPRTVQGRVAVDDLNQAFALPRAAAVSLTDRAAAERGLRGHASIAELVPEIAAQRAALGRPDYAGTPGAPVDYGGGLDDLRQQFLQTPAAPAAAPVVPEQTMMDTLYRDTAERVAPEGGMARLDAILEQAPEERGPRGATGSYAPEVTPSVGTGRRQRREEQGRRARRGGGATGSFAEQQQQARPEPELVQTADPEGNAINLPAPENPQDVVELVKRGYSPPTNRGRNQKDVERIINAENARELVAQGTVAPEALHLAVWDATAGISDKPADRQKAVLAIYDSLGYNAYGAGLKTEGLTPVEGLKARQQAIDADIAESGQVGQARRRKLDAARYGLEERKLAHRQDTDRADLLLRTAKHRLDLAEADAKGTNKTGAAKKLADINKGKLAYLQEIGTDDPKITEEGFTATLSHQTKDALATLDDEQIESPEGQQILGLALEAAFRQEGAGQWLTFTDLPDAFNLPILDQLVMSRDGKKFAVQRPGTTATFDETLSRRQLYAAIGKRHADKIIARLQSDNRRF